MSTYVSDDLRNALEVARIAGLRKISRLRVLADGEFYPVLRLWRDGFSVETETAAHLRGLVDLYDGERHLCQCLIVTSGEEGGEVLFEFKRSTIADDRAPRDFYRAPDAPVALIGRSS